MKNNINGLESDLPAGLAKPAQRALARAGYVRLEQFTKITEAEILKLHGMGHKAVDQLRRALAARGLSFAAASGEKRLIFNQLESVYPNFRLPVDRWTVVVPLQQIWIDWQ